MGQTWMDFVVLIAFVFGWGLYGGVKIGTTSNLVFFDGFFLDALMIGTVAVEGFADLIAIIEG